MASQPMTALQPEPKAGRYAPSTIVLIALLVGLGIAGDGYRSAYNVPAWQLWGAIGILTAITLLWGADSAQPVVSRGLSLWRSKIAQGFYAEALKEMVSTVGKDPEGTLDLYLEVANLYASPEVSLPQDAIVWLTALYDRISDTDEAGEVLLRRAELNFVSLGRSREAVIDLTVVLREFAHTPAAARAALLLERIQQDSRKKSVGV